MSLSTRHINEAEDSLKGAVLQVEILSRNIAELLEGLQLKDINVQQISAVRDAIQGVTFRIDHATQSYIRALHSE